MYRAGKRNHGQGTEVKKRDIRFLDLMDINLSCGEPGWDGCEHSAFEFFCRER